MLDHRDDWHWLWQKGVSHDYLPQVVIDKAKSGSIRLYQVSPYNTQHELSGGMTAIWWRNSSSDSWQASRFVNSVLRPLVYQILFDEQQPGCVWLASDNGIWRSTNDGRDFHPFSLVGHAVTAIARSGHSTIYAVIERGRIFQLDIATDALQELKLSAPAKNNLPNEISLSRFVRDLHYGRGINSVNTSLLWNDITGIALVIMPLSGFLFYWLPKRWKRRKASGADVNHKYKKQSMRWLFRLHGPTFGLISFIPVLFLAITGIMLDHGTDLRQWMKQTPVTRTFQTPVYNLSDWQGHIYGITVTQSGDMLSLATRLGLFTSANKGEIWIRENVMRDQAVFVWTLRQFSGWQLIGGMGSPNFIRAGNGTGWQKINGHVHMPTDITRHGKDFLLKNKKGLWRVSENNKPEQVSIRLPETKFIPWFYVIDGLHSGALIHEQWKWVNDLIAILAIVLVISGLMRWWKTKWI